MKKSAVMFLLALYSVTTTGAPLHLHYCMQEFAGISLWHSEDADCSYCGMHHDKGNCCTDEHKQIKLTTLHYKLDATQGPAPVPVPTEFLPPSSFLMETIAYTGIPHIHTGAPPPAHTQPLHVMLCVFRI